MTRVSPESAIPIVILGATGRMGRAVAEAARARSELAIVGGIAHAPAEVDGVHAVGIPAAASLIEAARVVVDFSRPAALASFVDLHQDALRGRALVTGTTGTDAATRAALDRLSESSAVLAAANFSVGVNLLIAMAERAAAVLTADSYDVEIVETHHAAKVDAPSGTALALGEAVAAGRGMTLSTVRRDGRSGDTGPRPSGEIAFHSLRGGSVAGMHRVEFIGRRERIELAHEAVDRALFAEGALVAARWIADRQPGLYTMRDVLGL